MTQPGETEATDWLSRVVLEGEALTRLSPVLEADRAQAVADLEQENTFSPELERARGGGPFVLHLSIQQGRLVFDIRAEDETALSAVVLSLSPFRRLMKDYELLVESHIKAVHEGRAERIQAIDMGRRGLHNDGAALLRGRLEGKITVDFETARRLFTLLCVLHQRMDAHT
jgi:uncharacterized protein (UPF0262 family)